MKVHDSTSLGYNHKPISVANVANITLIKDRSNVQKEIQSNLRKIGSDQWERRGLGMIKWV